jgi:hypothetical protein
LCYHYQNRLNCTAIMNCEGHQQQDSLERNAQIRHSSEPSRRSLHLAVCEPCKIISNTPLDGLAIPRARATTYHQKDDTAETRHSYGEYVLHVTGTPHLHPYCPGCDTIRYNNCVMAITMTSCRELRLSRVFGMGSVLCFSKLVFTPDLPSDTC